MRTAFVTLSRQCQLIILTALKKRTVLKESCFLCVQKCWQEKMRHTFSAFFKHFFFYKQIKINRGGRFFPQFFYLLTVYFIGAGGDENLKIYWYGLRLCTCN